MDKQDLKQDLQDGLSIRQIADKTGKSFTSVRHWMKKYDLKSSHLAVKRATAAKCEECGEDDPAEFYGDRKKKCKACHIKRDVGIGIAKKTKAIDYMGGKCVCCGYDRYYGALHFHHLDPTTKEDWGSIRGWGWERLKTELNKCVLVCSNCHAEIHGGVKDDSKLRAGPPVAEEMPG